MAIVENLLHFFTPRHTNNHRPAALSFSAISVYVMFLLVFQIALTLAAKYNPDILGYATNISVNDLLRISNEKRMEAGVPVLALNNKLSDAARRKAADMFASQYWAHTSPEGRDPWSFVTSSGYSYLYAGENLARDFAESRGVVEAWMNSATHKENLVNPKYKEVGFAVVDGKYGSYETTLVVQMFGTPAQGAPTVEAPPVAQKPLEPVLEINPAPQVLPAVVNPVPVRKTDTFGLTKSVSMALTFMLMAVLALDALLIYRRRVIRVSGHSLAHLMVLFVLLVVLNLINRGVVL
jgi:hypothetical protein